MTWLLLVVGTLVVAVLVAAATATRAVSRLWLRHWIERRAVSAGAMQRYLERPVRLTHAAATAVGVTVFSVAALVALDAPAGGWPVARDIVLFLLAVVLVGQLAARAVGRRFATVLVPVLVPVLRVVDLVLLPVQQAGLFVARLLPGRAARPAEADPLEGLEELLRDGALEGLGAADEMAIISGFVQFGDKRVADVMTPRAEIFALDESLPPGELAREVAQSAYSRVPIYRGTLDTVVGMIHAFDVFRVAGERRPALRPVTFTSPSRPANELLFELLRARRQMAIVREEGGPVLGLVTLEDLLEELVGDIRDEHDEPAPRATEGGA
jgi:putative hemolysin